MTSPTTNTVTELLVRQLREASNSTLSGFDKVHARALMREAAAALSTHPHTGGREAVIEECAVIAAGHSARRERLQRGRTFSDLPEGAQIEIAAEERGEDIAAHEIAKAIRALASPPLQKTQKETT